MEFEQQINLLKKLLEGSPERSPKQFERVAVVLDDVDSVRRQVLRARANARSQQDHKVLDRMNKTLDWVEGKRDERPGGDLYFRPDTGVGVRLRNALANVDLSATRHRMISDLYNEIMDEYDLPGELTKIEKIYEWIEEQRKPLKNEKSRLKDKPQTKEVQARLNWIENMRGFLTKVQKEC